MKILDFRQRRGEAFRQADLDVLHGRISGFEAHERLARMGFLPGSGDVMGDLRKLSHGGLAKAFTSGTQELLGIGPGLALTGYGLATHPERTAEQVGGSMYHSAGETIHHPGRQFEQDPLGLVSNLLVGAGAAGRVADIGAAARAGGIGEAARTAIGPARPRLRTMETGNEGKVLHPPSSRNTGFARLQDAADRFFNSAVVNPQDTAGRLANLPGVRRVVGPEVRIGRRLRSEADYRRAEASAPAEEIAAMGSSIPAQAAGKAIGKVSTGARVKLPATIFGRGHGRLSAAQEKAVQIIASGKSAAEHIRYHEHARELGIGSAKGHKLQLELTKAASAYLGDHTSPLVETAAMAARAAIHAREHTLGMAEEDALHRLGAHASEIEHGAAGFVGESPLEQLERLEQAYRATPDTQAAAHIRDQLSAEIDRLHGQLVDKGSQVRERGGFYLPMQDERTVLGRPRSGKVSAEARYGIGPVRQRKMYRYGGKLQRAGTFRPVASQLAAHASREAAHLDIAQQLREELFNQGHLHPADVPGGEANAQAIRRTVQVPAALKEAVNALAPGHVLPNENTEALLRALDDHYFPKHPAPNDDVRYLSKDRIAPLRAYQRDTISEFLNRVTQPLRFRRYLSPNYLWWLPQNALFTLPAQGPLAVRNLWTRFHEIPRLTPAEQARLRALAGSGPSMALRGTSKQQAVQTHVAHFWHRVNDSMPRQLAVINEMHRFGYHGAEDIKRLLAGPPGSKEARDRAQIAEVAGKEAGDYRLSNAERKIAKSLIPWWAWIKASGRWTLRLPVEHPVTGSFAAAEGRQGRKSVDAFWRRLHGAAPLSLEGALPVHGGRVLDTAALNPTETPAQIAEDVRGMLPGRTALRGRAASDFAPIPSAIAEAVMGVKKHGTPDPTGTAAERQLIHYALPPGLADVVVPPSKTSYFKSNPLQRGLGSPLERIDTAAAAKAGEQEQLAAEPAPQRAYKRVFAKRDEMYAAALKLGEVKPGEKLPAELRNAWNIQARRQTLYAKLGPKPTQQQKLSADLRLAAQLGVASSADIAEVQQLAKGWNDEQIRRARERINHSYFDYWRISAGRKYLNERGAGLSR